MPYLGRSPGSGVRSRFIYAATSGQTSFSGNDSNSVSLAYEDTLYMDVYQNGVLLKPVTDYTSTTGTSVVLATGATTDDVVEMIVYDTFAVADTVSAKDGGTFAGNIAVTGNVTTTGTVEPAGDTSAGDNAAIGFTSAEGLILTGQGSTSDITVKNDADATVFTVPTGTDDILFPDNAKAMFGAGSDLQIYHDASDSYVQDTGTGDLKILGNNIKLRNNGDSIDYIATNASSGAITLSHDGSSKFVTTSTGVAITGGVAIGGTGAANTLDDYEEGTFTPRFQQGLTSAGYSTQQGAYTKIGRQVICSLFLRANSGTENGDAIFIGGLPFTVRNASSVDHSEGAFWTYNGSFWTSDVNTSWLARVNETNLAFFKQSDGGAIQGSTSGVATNLNADVRLVVVYTTN